MSEFKVQTRPDRRSKNSPTARLPATAPNQPARIGLVPVCRGLPSFGRRAAVVATACAVLIGVGAAGQAAEQATPPATSDAQHAATPGRP